MPQLYCYTCRRHIDVSGKDGEKNFRAAGHSNDKTPLSEVIDAEHRANDTRREGDRIEAEKRNRARLDVIRPRRFDPAIRAARKELGR